MTDREIFDLVRESYHTANGDYIAKQVEEARKCFADGVKESVSLFNAGIADFKKRVNRELSDRKI